LPTASLESDYAWHTGGLYLQPIDDLKPSATGVCSRTCTSDSSTLCADLFQRHTACLPTARAISPVTDTRYSNRLPQKRPVFPAVDLIRRCTRVIVVINFKFVIGLLAHCSIQLFINSVGFSAMVFAYIPITVCVYGLLVGILPEVEQ
jgi:hypothetical protein